MLERNSSSSINSKFPCYIVSLSTTVDTPRPINTACTGGTLLRGMLTIWRMTLACQLIWWGYTLFWVPHLLYPLGLYLLLQAGQDLASWPCGSALCNRRHLIVTSIATATAHYLQSIFQPEPWLIPAAFYLSL